MDDYNEPEVIEEKITGWVWNRDLRGAMFYQDMYRYSTGHLALLRNGQEVVLSATRSRSVFPYELDALEALAEHHTKKAQAAAQRALALRRRIDVKFTSG